jgi:5'-3' exonuclease
VHIKLKFGMSNAYMESLIEKNLVEINTENVTEFGDITLSSTVPMEELQNPSSKHNVRTYVQCYIEGLHWVLNYYKRGVPSWGWYYPFLYAPVASDFKNLTEINVTIPVGKPYTSFAQLLSVLPPLSKSLLPECYSRLMSHPNSHISEYFPDDFVIDCNGRDEWAGK